MKIEHIADLLADHAPARSSRRQPRPTKLQHEKFTITATAAGVRIFAPAQQVADRPFQPPAERPHLPAVLLEYRWADLRPAFAALRACEPDLAHPAADWLERIIEHVRATEAIEILISVWCVSWTKLACRSMWTGLERDDLLTAAQFGGCKTHEQAIARADVVAAQFRSRGRIVAIKDTVALGPKLKVRPTCPPEVAPQGKRSVVHIGQLTITVTL